MKKAIFFTLVLVLGYVSHQFLPWWAIGVTALLVSAVVNLRPGASFLWGFLAAALLWGGMSIWLHQSGDGLLAGKMGALFGGLPVWGLIGITGLIGGLLGGMGALTGSLGRRLSP